MAIVGHDSGSNWKIVCPVSIYKNAPIWMITRAYSRLG